LGLLAGLTIALLGMLMIFRIALSNRCHSVLPGIAGGGIGFIEIVSGILVKEAS